MGILKEDYTSNLPKDTYKYKQLWEEQCKALSEHPGTMTSLAVIQCLYCIVSKDKPCHVNATQKVDLYLVDFEWLEDDAISEYLAILV